MTMSELLTTIKMNLGIYVIPLPFDDNMLVEVIKSNTLRVFSNMYPHKITMDIPLSDCEKINETFQESTYRMPEYFSNMKVTSIFEIDCTKSLYDSAFYNGMYGNPFNVVNSSDMYGGLMMGQANYDLMSYAAPPFTFKYEYPNILTLYNMSTFTDKIRITFGYQHPENLSTIKPTMEDSFLELATLDLKVFLYNNLKYYDQTNTAIAQLNLMLDNWSNAESERKDFVEKMTDELNFSLINQFNVI